MKLSLPLKLTDEADLASEQLRVVLSSEQSRDKKYLRAV